MGDAVYCTELSDGVRVWVISGYKQAKAALEDPGLSLAAAGQVLRLRRAEATKSKTRFSRMHAPHMLTTDNPEHAHLRDPVAPAFTRGRVEALRPRIEALTNRLLDRLPTGEPVDLVRHLAVPLPLTVICELLGVPEDDQHQVHGWAEDLMIDAENRALTAARQQEASQAMGRYFEDLVQAKRDMPADDLVSALIDDDTLTADELVTTLFLLIIAGSETTTNLIGNAVRHLLAEPERWRVLHHDRALVPGAVEELLRYDPPVKRTTYRCTTAEAVEYDGVTIPPGELVLVSLDEANRDAAVFEHPDELDLHRDARKHLSFGHGVHRCLGAYLGLLEVDTAIGLLTSRWPNARLDTSYELRRKASPLLNGFAALHVVLAD